MKHPSENFTGFFADQSHVSQMEPTDPFSKSSLFQKAVQGILRPLVRALIAQGLTAPAFYRIVKQTYVDIAAEDLKDKATDSRISVLTGVHRRDVKTFRTLDQSDPSDIQAKVSTLATVVGRWLSDPDWTDADGAAKPMPREHFETLVASVSKDIRPRTVLDELIRQEIITVEDNILHLQLEGLVGPANMEQRLHFFSHNVGDHMSAAVENLLRDDPQLLERAVFYNALTKASVDELHQDARDFSNSALRKLNAKASSLQVQDAKKPDGTNRFRFGVFFFHEDDDTNGDDEK